jgi:undecaprenol kinase
MNKYVKVRTLKQGFINAFAGLGWAFKTQNNFKIHFLALFIALFFGFILRITYPEWLILITVVAGALILELVNTSLEQATDAFTTEYNHFIKQAKDTAAAAVLVYAFYSLVIAIIIFGPRFVQLIFGNTI